MFDDNVMILDVLLDQLLHRVPGMSQAQVSQLINGPESFTPDSKPILGESPEVSLLVSFFYSKKIYIVTYCAQNIPDYTSEETFFQNNLGKNTHADYPR